MPVREKSQALAEYGRCKTTFTIDTMKEFILWDAFSFPAARSPEEVGRKNVPQANILIQPEVFRYEPSTGKRKRRSGGG
jgi:hypothetical protein